MTLTQYHHAFWIIDSQRREQGTVVTAMDCRIVVYHLYT